MRTVLAIIHTYARDGELGSYMTELVNAFKKFDIKLHLLITNTLVENLGEKRLDPKISERKYIDYIKNIAPDFIFTTNRGGITKNIMRELDIPILTWMVDRIPFLHHGGGHEDLFNDNDYVITSSFKNVERLETIYPTLKGRVFFLPFATNPSHFIRKYEKDINISFVGTYFYCGQLTEIFQTYQNFPKTISSILSLIKEIEEDYELDFPLRLKAHGLEHLLKEYDLDVYKLKGLLANNISLNWRVRCLDSIANQGLKLYGTPNWINVNPFSSRLLSCYQQESFIKTREDLTEIYQRSKIALNVPHVQAVDGLPYRVYDIMASDALLISNFRKDSDLFRLFGRDMPVPLYRDEYDLAKQVKHYLSHSYEREQLVKECNKLIQTGFSFEDRVKSFFDILGINLSKGMGQVIQVDTNQFSIQKHTRINVSSISKKQKNLIDFFQVTKVRAKIMLKRYLPSKLVRAIRYIRIKRL